MAFWIFGGAVYLNPNTGRFWTMDTYEGDNEDPLSQNKYLYANDPVNNADPSGHWPTRVLPVHQNAILQTLTFLPQSDLDILTDRQIVMDQFQSSFMAFLHAMRAPWQPREDAWLKANRFIYSELSAARAFQKVGNRGAAMTHLGNAMHTLQDSTSPVHKGFQVWDDRWNNSSDPVVNHVFGEFYDPGPGSDLYRITQTAYAYFLGSGALPPSFIPKPTGSEVPPPGATLSEMLHSSSRMQILTPAF